MYQCPKCDSDEFYQDATELTGARAYFNKEHDDIEVQSYGHFYQLETFGDVKCGECDTKAVEVEI